MAGRVSLILPTYNRADLIAETIESLLAQTRQIDEIIIIDDGSTDGTGDKVKAFGDKVRYHRKENGGKAAALNLALTLVDGDFIWICDDDDLVLPETCARLAGALENDPGLDFCAGKHEDFIVDHASGIVRKEPGYWRPSTPEQIFYDAMDGCHIFQPGLLVRRSLYDTVGPFNEALTRSQDYEMLLRLTREGQGVLLPDTVFLHREHLGLRGSATERFSFAEANKKWIKFHRMIMQPLMADLADNELLPASEWDVLSREGRGVQTSRIRRGSVYARHLMWAEAFDTWKKVATEFEAPVSAREIEIIRNATGYSLGCAPLYEDTRMKRELAELKRTSSLGRQIAYQVGRSLFWRMKQAAFGGRVGEFSKLASTVVASR